MDIPKDFIMGLFDLLKSKKKQNYYGGGNGESAENAVIINTTTSLQGIPAEYAFVASKCGKENIDWTFESQMTLRSNDRNYDYITVQLNNGDKKSFYFDITQFYGKF